MARPAITGDYTISGEDRAVLAAVIYGVADLLTQAKKTGKPIPVEVIAALGEGLEVARRALALRSRDVGPHLQGLLTEDSALVGQLSDLLGENGRRPGMIFAGVMALKMLAQQNSRRDFDQGVLAEGSRALQEENARLRAELAALKRRQRQVLTLLTDSGDDLDHSGREMHAAPRPSSEQS